MSNNAVIVEKLFDVPVEKVWKAITDKDEMKEWYFNLDDFKAEPGFEFSFAGQGHKGEQYIHVCKITEVVPYKKLQYSWRYIDYEGYSLVTFELFEEGNKTRLKLTHEGLETFPQGSPDFAKESFTAGWTHIVTISLDQFLAKEK
jgi:uncharacterized protein YndB with AHSA1/START domain